MVGVNLIYRFGMEGGVSRGGFGEAVQDYGSKINISMVSTATSNRFISFNLSVDGMIGSKDLVVLTNLS